MPKLRSNRRLWSSALSAGAVAFALGMLVPTSARAHFILETPASWMSQDVLGAPEKLGPCGDEGGGTASNTVTSFQSGQTITVTINEVIFHPGHYRIALSVNDRSELPAEPLVTAGAMACGTVPVQSPPVFPVLADGVFDHTTAFSGPQSVQITLPSNVTCTHCTLQVIEFMSDHGLNNPGGCFYHHCADISMQEDAGVSTGGMDAGGTGGMDAAIVIPVDAATGGGGDAAVSHVDASGGGAGPDSSTSGNGSSSSTASSSSGCSVSVSKSSAGAGFAGLLAFASLALLRRRRATQ